MSDNPLVSVVMPGYNCEDSITASIKSVLNQTMADFELLIVDDCSTDGTPEAIAELSSADSRIKAMQNKQNLGVAATRNRAVDTACGEYLAFIDSDDQWEPNKLEMQLNHMAQTGCGICYTSYDYFCNDGTPVFNPYIVPEVTDYERLLKENVIGLSTAVLRSSTLGNQRFDESIFHEDFALWLSMLRQGAIACGITEILTHNRVGGRSENKCKALINRWRVYRKSEKLPLAISCYYIANYAFAGLKKYS